MTAQAGGEDNPGAATVPELVAALKRALADAEASSMSRTRHHELHRLVDHLEPEQADLVRALVLQLVVGGRAVVPDATPERRRFAFTDSISAEPDLAERSNEILDEMVRRNAG